MTTMQEHIEELERRRREALEMGGPEKIARQHSRGKLTARERVALLVDPGSFHEYGMLASHHGQKPNEKPTPADGLVMGVGRIHGRPVALFAEDATLFGGACGEVNGIKRMRILDVARKEKIPLICLLDGAGFRVQSMAHGSEGSPAIGHTLRFGRHSGTAPTVAVVLGACAGEPALEAAIMEYLIMVKGTGMLAAGGPPVVKASTGLDISKEDLGGVSIHASGTGMVDNVARDDAEALALTRKYLSYLPTSAWNYPPSVEPKDAKPGSAEKIDTILPESLRNGYDMFEVIECIVDEGSFFETKAEYGQALITGFARLNGHSIGIIASQPLVRAGALSGPEGQKARKFIDLCNAYHVPLVSLTDTPGVMTGPDAEKEGSLKYGLAAAHSLAWADVPIFSVILRKAFGFGGSLMAGSFGEQTVAMVWPTVDFSSLPADSAVEAAHAKELEEAEDREALYAQLIEQYSAFGGPYPAAATNNIDEIIAPHETRTRLIQALELSLSRRQEAAKPTVKYGVMP